jgi:hypothetical protein
LEFGRDLLFLGQPAVEGLEETLWEVAVLAVADTTSSGNRRLLGGLVVNLSVGDAGADCGR